MFNLELSMVELCNRKPYARKMKAVAHKIFEIGKKELQDGGETR